MPLLVFFLSAAGILFFFFILAGRKNSKLPVSLVSIGKKTFRAERAAGILEKIRGFSGRDGLGEDEGMLFLFRVPGRHAFWMKGMKFPIDIVWVRSNKVVGFSEDIEPELGKLMWRLVRHYPPSAVDAVLEIEAGAVRKFRLMEGDAVSVHR